MKYAFAALLALLMALPARAEINPTNVFMGRWRDAQVEMKILPEYQDDGEEGDLALYPIDILWTSPEGVQATWTMTARYNARENRLEYGDGTKIENGDIALSGTRGYMKLNGDGKIRWTDAAEDESTRLSFAREVSPAPTVGDFEDSYFRVVADLGRGTTDAARRAARTIVRVLQFAEIHDLWNVDGEAAQANLNAAWERLTPEEQARFDAVFDDGISDPTDEAFERYSALRRVFEDAGVGAEMARLTASLEVRLSWEFLSSATLNMDSMEDGYENAVG